MRSIWFSVVILGVAAMSVGVDGCGSGTGTTAMCGNTDTCQMSDPACTRACGRGQSMLCECGTGALAGVLVCGPCAANDAGMQGTGGRMGRGTGGAQGTGGRMGRGTGGAQGTGGAPGAGGRMGRGTGGAQGTGGRMGRGTGGAQGTGGATPSDGGIAACPGNVEGGGVSCMANVTPICQTACVNLMYNVCTCAAGTWNCPTTQIPCP